MVYRSSLVMALLIASFTVDAKIEVNASLSAILTGQWGWNIEGSDLSCGGNTHTVKLSDDNKKLYIEFLKAIPAANGLNTKRTSYTVVGFNTSNSTVTMTLDGEKRKDSQEKSVKWDLIILDSVSYTWHRHDWPEGATTPVIVQCSNA